MRDKVYIIRVIDCWNFPRISKCGSNSSDSKQKKKKKQRKRQIWRCEIHFWWIYRFCSRSENQQMATYQPPPKVSSLVLVNLASIAPLPGHMQNRQNLLFSRAPLQRLPPNSSAITQSSVYDEKTALWRAETRFRSITGPVTMDIGGGGGDPDQPKRQTRGLPSVRWVTGFTIFMIKV